MPSKVYCEMGRYWGRVTHQKLGKSSNGNPQIMVSFVILGKVNAADPEGDLLPVTQQYERTVFRVITDKTIEWVMQDLDKLGWTGEDWATFDEGHPQCCSIVGAELAFSCKHEAHYLTGEPREVWSVAQDNPGLAVVPLETSELRKLNALFGKALKGRQKSEPKAQPARTPATPPPIGSEAAAVEAAEADDGVPF